MFILVAVAIGVVAVWRSFHEPFTKEKWIHATPQMRDRLMEGLAESGMLMGLTEGEVYELLGEPDGASHGGVSYALSHERGWSGPCLLFAFTRDGYVESAGLSSMGGTVSHANFEAEVWRDGTPADRLSMVRDLIASQPLEGMHSEDLYRLLGKPDHEPPTGHNIWFSRRYYGENGEIKKRLAGASKCLYIRFRDGRVEQARFTGS